MKSRKFFALIVATVTALAVAVLPAQADTVGVTFELTSTGTLSVSSASATHDYGALDAASAVGGALPEVTVTDNRNPFLGSWTVTVDATEFTTTDGTNSYTIPGTAVEYYSGAVTPDIVSGGAGVITGSQLTDLDAVQLDQQRTAATGTGLIGNNSATFTPTLDIDVTGAPTGVYDGDIVHSVTGA